jgi:hypothetical protein
MPDSKMMERPDHRNSFFRSFDFGMGSTIMFVRPITTFVIFCSNKSVLKPKCNGFQVNSDLMMRLLL